MKKIAFMICLLVLTGIFSACSVGRIADMVSEAAAQDDTTEVSQEYQTGDSTDADSTSLIVSTESDTVMVGGDLSWPAEYMGDIPQINGTISAVVTYEGCGAVTVEGITKGEAESYLKGLKALGYSGTEATDGSTLFFCGTNVNGATVMFEFDYEAGEAYIEYTAAA